MIAPTMKYLGPPQSGSLANETASRNPFGQYMRARVGRGGVPDLSIAGAVAGWQALSHARQLAWGEFAKTVPQQDSLGRAVTLSGYQFYVRAWLFATWASSAPDSDAPTARVNNPITGISLTAAGLVVTAHVPHAATSGGIIEVAWAVPIPSSGTNSPPGRGCYWLVENRAVVSGAGTMTGSHTYPSSGRAFAQARFIGFDWVPGPWLRAAFLAI